MRRKSLALSSHLCFRTMILGLLFVVYVQSSTAQRSCTAITQPVQNGWQYDTSKYDSRQHTTLRWGGEPPHRCTAGVWYIFGAEGGMFFVDAILAPCWCTVRVVVPRQSMILYQSYATRTSAIPLSLCYLLVEHAIAYGRLQPTSPEKCTKWINSRVTPAKHKRWVQHLWRNSIRNSYCVRFCRICTFLTLLWSYPECAFTIQRDIIYPIQTTFFLYIYIFVHTVSPLFFVHLRARFNPLWTVAGLPAATPKSDNNNSPVCLFLEWKLVSRDVPTSSGSRG